MSGGDELDDDEAGGELLLLLTLGSGSERAMGVEAACGDRTTFGCATKCETPLKFDCCCCGCGCGWSQDGCG